MRPTATEDGRTAGAGPAGRWPFGPQGRFPLADWIDAHAACRYDLATSGMRGSVAAPPWPARRAPGGAAADLQHELASHLGVDPARLFLSHGASEANAWVLGHLARELLNRTGRAPVARVHYPEYPPLFDGAGALGFRVRGDARPADLAIVSRPRNPEGDVWPEGRVGGFARGTRHLLVDETFREFADVPSLAAAGAPRVWTTGSFTKFFGADEVRVGFAVAPPEAVARFARYVGVVSDEVAPSSAAVALRLLRELPGVRRAVRRLLDRNVRAFRAAYRTAPAPAGPMFFDRLRGGGGGRLAAACLRASVLVCPGGFFGDTGGVRVCLTRRDFPEGLKAYLRVRRGPSSAARRGAEVNSLHGASGRPAEPELGRPRRGARGRARGP